MLDIKQINSNCLGKLHVHTMFIILVLTVYGHLTSNIPCLNWWYAALEMSLQLVQMFYRHINV